MRSRKIITKYDVIIIGSGIGGLAAAALLSHRGMKVLVLEKNGFIGGRLSSYKRGEYTLDMGGMHILSQSDKGPIGNIFRRISMPNPIEYTYVRPLSSYKGKTFIFPHDLKTMIPVNDFSALMQLLKGIQAMPKEEVMKYDHLDLKSFLSQHINHSLTYACMTNLSIIWLSMPPWLASAGEFIRCLQMESRSRASGYPQGGCSTISKAFANAVEKFGGKIKTKTKCENIRMEKGQVTGVTTKEGFYQANIVISNADIKNTVLNLVGPQYFSEDYVTYIKKLAYSWGGMAVDIALDKALTDFKLLTHIGFDDPEDYFSKLHDGIVPDEVAFMLSVPSNFSTLVAPLGKQLISIGTVSFPKLNNQKEKMVRAVLASVEKFIPGLQDHIIWIHSSTQADLEHMVGEEGAVIGIAQTPQQSGDKRPSVTSPIKGLYFCGAEAGGTGVGAELAVSSAIELVSLLL